MDYKADFCRYFLFFYYYYSFQDHIKILYFFPKCFPRHYLSKNATAVDAKHRQVLANTKKSPLRKNLVVIQKPLRENCDASFMHKIFRHQKFFQTQKGSPANYEIKKLTKNMIHPLSKVFPYQKLTEAAEQAPQEIFLRGKKFPTTLFDTPFYGSLKITHSTDEQQQKLSETPEISGKTNRAPLLLVRYCGTKIFRYYFVIYSDKLVKLSRRTVEQRRL